MQTEATTLNSICQPLHLSPRKILWISFAQYKDITHFERQQIQLLWFDLLNEKISGTWLPPSLGTIFILGNKYWFLFILNYNIYQNTDPVPGCSHASPLNLTVWCSNQHEISHQINVFKFGHGCKIFRVVKTEYRDFESNEKVCETILSYIQLFYLSSKRVLGIEGVQR